MVVNILLWCRFGLIAGVLARYIGNEGERTDPGPDSSKFFFVAEGPASLYSEMV
jgi:hypothetical protein